MDGATLHEPSGKLGRGPFVAPLKRCPECKQHATSVLRLVTITVDKEGKTSTEKADLSPRYVVDPATYERLAALHGKPPAPPPAAEPAPPA